MSLEFDGVDVFIVSNEIPAVKNSKIQKIGDFELKVISNRGQKIWPGKTPPIELVDVFRCRFVFANNQLKNKDILELLKEIDSLGFEWVHLEKLLRINNKAAYSTIQGD